jgi:hypothetical protein
MLKAVVFCCILALLCSATFAAAPEWINLSLREQRVLHSVLHHDNKIYIAGGSQGNGSTLNSIEILDTKSLSWTYTNLTSPRALMASVVCNNMLIFAAGNQHGHYTSRMDIFDTEAGIWFNTTFPIDVEGMGATCVNDRYAVFAGGQISGDFSSLIHVYDTVSRQFNLLSTTMRRARWQPRVNNYNEFVIITGGYLREHPFGISEGIDVINIFTGERVLLPAMPSVRANHNTFIFNNRLFVVGGLRQIEVCANVTVELPTPVSPPVDEAPVSDTPVDAPVEAPVDSTPVADPLGWEISCGPVAVTNERIDILNLDTWIWEPFWNSPVAINYTLHGFALPTGQMALVSDKADIAFYDTTSRSFSVKDINIANFERFSMESVLTDTMIVIVGGWVRKPNVTDSYTVDHVNIYRYLDAPLPPTNLPPSQRVATPNPSTLPILDCVRNINDVTYVAYFGYDNPTPSTQFIPVGDSNKFSPEPNSRGQVDVFGSGRSTYYPLSPFQIIFTTDADKEITWTLGRYALAFKPSDTSLACNADIVFLMEIVFTSPPNDTVFKAVNQRLTDLVNVPITRISIKSISPVEGKELTYLVEFVIAAPSNGKELSSAEILRRLTQQFKTNPDSLPVLLQENAPTVKSVTRLEGVPPSNPIVGTLIEEKEESAAEVLKSSSAILVGGLAALLLLGN